MRILHFSDLHIGVESYGATDPDTGLSSRLGDFLHSYDQVVQYAIDEQVDFVLFAGDAYKSRDPSQTHQREFARRIATLTQHGIPVFLLVGNHDLPTIASRATALEIFPTLDIPNVHVAERLATALVSTRSGPLQVVSLPWIRRSAFLAREETRDLTIEEINRLLQERLTRLLHREVQALDPQVPAVLTAHVSLNTAVTSSEQSMMLGRDHVLLQSNLAHPSLDYVALGHIHKHQVLAWGHPLMAYSGSLQRIDFGEEKDNKGFCIVDLDPQAPAGERVKDFRFIPVEARPFVTVSVEIDAQEPNPTDAVLRAIAKRQVREAIVRLQVRLPEHLEPQLQDGVLRQALADAHYVAAIQRDVVRQSRPRLTADAVESMTPAQVLRHYLEEQRVPPARLEALLRYGDDLFREELAEEL